MKNRKPVVITIIVLLVACALILTVLILLSSINNQPLTTTPVSYVSSYPTGTTISPGGTQTQNYVYALINSSDNIKMKTALGEELLINIDTKNWKDIQWSANGSYISVLGETADGVFNIFIYNLSTKLWIQPTIFTTNGVSSYTWTDDDTILFTADGWLHTYKYSTINEIVKIYQTDGTIDSLSPNKATLVIKNADGTFQVVGIDGKLLFTLDKITITNSDQTSSILTINQVYYDKSAEDLLFVTQDNKFYSWDLGSSSAKEITIQGDDGLDPTKVKLLCSQDVGIYKSYTIASNALNFFNLDSTNKVLNSITSKSLNTGSIPSNFNCTDDQVEFEISNTTGNNWYRLLNGKVEELVPLDEATDVAIKGNM